MQFIHSIIRQIAQELGKHGSYRVGRRTGDADYDAFLRCSRLHRAAVKRLSPDIQKEWNNKVRECNSELTIHWRRQTSEQRVQFRKLKVGPGLPSSLQQRQVDQIEARKSRFVAIATVCRSLQKEGKKATVKVVCRRMEKDFPELPIVKQDTLRKDLHKLKVACQSR